MQTSLGEMIEIDAIKRVHLANLPTPIEEAPRLAREIGLSRLLVKRDDLTSLAMGGNKARKLEYDFAQILENGSDVVLTIGGAQSNHARMTVAAARKLGLDAKIVLGGPDFTDYQGNLLLDVVLGAEIRYLKNNDNNDDLAAAMKEWADELRNQGRRPFALPIGGSTGLGALGYVMAVRELAGQISPGPIQIILAVGSCGTLAGVVLGAKMFMPESRVIGISVSRTSTEIARRTAEIANEAARIIKSDLMVTEAEIESYDRYFQEYGVTTEAGQEAILACAQLEGILLDPVYTGKAMAGLMDLAKKGVLERSIPTVFIHTGGLPILFAFGEEFGRLALCRKI